jgi:hypothetical protein
MCAYIYIHPVVSAGLAWIRIYMYVCVYICMSVYIRMGYMYTVCVCACVCVCIFRYLYIYVPVAARGRPGLGCSGSVPFGASEYAEPPAAYLRRREEGKPMRGVSTRLVSWHQPARPFVEWHGMRLCTPWHRSARGDAALQCSHRRSGVEFTPAAPREYS